MRSLSCGRMRAKTTACPHPFLQLLVAQCGQLAALQDLALADLQADVARDALGRAPIVAGDHLDLDARALGHGDRLAHALADRVFHGHQPHPGIAAVLLQRAAGGR